MHPSQAMTTDSQPPGPQFQLSDPPPDIIQPVQVVPQALAASGKPAWAQNNGGPSFRLSAPPPDVIQPVQVVEAFAQTQNNDGPSFRLSAPPPDVIQPVQVVAALSQAAAADPPGMAAFLSFKGIDYAHDIGSALDPEQENMASEGEILLNYQEMYQIIREVAVVDSGEDPYTAISADREYETPGQPAYQQRHFGLAFGLVLFTQESGLLGTLLTIMHRRDPVLFADIFGTQAEALLATTNAPTAPQRLQPVDGELIWSPAWTARFQRAGAEPTFQAAQNETAIEHQFRPMLNVAFGLGFSSDRGLAMVFDRVVTEGLGTGLRWVVRAAGALRTAAQRAHALQVLGYTNLAAFQAITGWTPQDGNFGPETHAALVGALRQQGGATLPTGRELMARLVTAATGPAQQRLIRLQDSTNFDDSVYRLQ